MKTILVDLDSVVRFAGEADVIIREDKTDVYRGNYHEYSFPMYNNSNCQKFEVEDIPEKVVNRMCYNETGGFYPNPQFVNPTEEAIEALKEENKTINAKLDLLIESLTTPGTN